MMRYFLLPVLLAIAPAGALHAQTWPSRPVQLVIPFPPGGGTDIIGRAIANKMQERIGRPVVVDNKPGVGGILGTQQVARAAADGHTVVIGITNTFAINTTFFKSMSYDPVRDFQPISLLAVGPHILVVHPETPARTYAEYVQYVKGNTGKLSYASYGNGSTSHLITEMLKQMHGLDLVHVPYKGIPPALADVMGNRVSMLVSSSAPAIPLVLGGRLRALAIHGDKRIDSLPDVPTMAELGYKDAGLQIWYGLFAPAGTPRAVVDRLNAEVRAAMATREVQDSFAKGGVFPAGMGVDEFTAFVRAETERWGKLVELAGMKGEGQ
ncbi:MAG: tripartite tricarboxylate transporter substrate binding protein [Betaproteobacteria bacterium]|nr:tripartite tricarboxylate transporter substrate binding protein [Betaproteobacteria bacterium]